MRTLLIAAACLALATPAHAHSALTWTSQGNALRTTRAASPHFADAPSRVALGHYGAAGTMATGRSTARMGHVQRLHTCNPFANVRATQPLAPC